MEGGDHWLLRHLVCEHGLAGVGVVVTDVKLTQAMTDVLAERQRQDAKWGQQNHDPFTYITILGEEFGELCQAALHRRFGGAASSGLRDEAVQTAAVALAIVECLDRGTWTFFNEAPKPEDQP